MNGVIGMIDLTIDASLPPQQREQLEIAKTSAESLLTIVNDILDLSKIEAGRVDLDETTFVLGDAVEDAVRTAGVGAQGRRQGRHGVATQNCVGGSPSATGISATSTSAIPREAYQAAVS